jgi:hypothetical protein
MYFFRIAPSLLFTTTTLMVIWWETVGQRALAHKCKISGICDLQKALHQYHEIYLAHYDRLVCIKLTTL